MIGMVNVPCDSPLDFYASPSRQDSIMSKDSCDVPRTPSQKTKQSSYRPLFTAAHRKKIQYTEDGRKISDGAVVETNEPNKLWEELFLRSFAQKLEEEIQSPVVESFKNLDSELAKLNVKDKNLYRSTYSLVSAARIEDVATLEELDRIEMKNKRSASTDRGNFCHLLPFIKTIRGKKSKDEKKHKTICGK